MAGRTRSWRTVAAAVVLGGLLALAGIAGGLSVPQSILSWAIVVGYALLVTGFQNRSETMSALSGRPVDERWKLIHERALGLTAQIGVAVAIAAYLITQFRHEDSTPFGFLSAVMGATYIAGIVLYRWRT